MNLKELQSAYSSLTEAVRLQQALNAIINCRVEQVHKYKESPIDGGSYVWTVADLDRAHGGLFMQTFRYKGQSDTLTAMYLDDIGSTFHSDSPVSMAMAEAVSKARGLRARMLDEAAS